MGNGVRDTKGVRLGDSISSGTDFARCRAVQISAALLVTVVFVMANCCIYAEAHNLHAPSFPQETQSLESIPLMIWGLALLGAAIVGSTGVLPLLFIPSNSSFKNGLHPDKMNVLLSFAVGGLLGDVFLHLLPETRAQMYTMNASAAGHELDTRLGLLVVAGLVTFLGAEKVMVVCSGEGEEEDSTAETSERSSDRARDRAVADGDPVLRRRPVRNGQNSTDEKSAAGANPKDNSDGDGKISPAGYLNLFANFVDNFTHGLAVAASFLAGPKVGLLTTFAIIIHEVPHEVGDFAILLNSGFDRWSAAKAQMSTASGAMLGALCGLLLRNTGESVLWVLPFTAGGFLYIALVSVMPTLLQERSPRQSIYQVVAMVAGIVTMYVMDISAAH